jgi:hypothetical protein
LSLSPRGMVVDLLSINWFFAPLAVGADMNHVRLGVIKDIISGIGGRGWLTKATGANHPINADFNQPIISLLMRIQS